MATQLKTPKGVGKQGNDIIRQSEIDKASAWDAIKPKSSASAKKASSSSTKKPAKKKLNWLQKDTTYLSELAALRAKQSAYLSGIKTQKANTRANYLASLQNLGWDSKTKSWASNDRTTAYGSNYNSLVGDNASRGMLQSSAYDQSFTDLLAGFTRQKGQLTTEKQQALTGLSSDVANYKTEVQNQKNQAKVAALSRKAATVPGTKTSTTKGKK